MFYLTTHTTHFYYYYTGVGHMVKDYTVRQETHCHYSMEYFFRLTEWDILYTLSHRKHNTTAFGKPVMGQSSKRDKRNEVKFHFKVHFLDIVQADETRNARRFRQSEAETQTSGY